MSEKILVLRTPLSSEAIYAKVGNDMTVDAAISKIIQRLENEGKNLESQALKKMYETHQLFNGNSILTKGTLISSLNTKEEVVRDQKINVAEIDLIATHSGGVI